jgi:hypothetical protein
VGINGMPFWIPPVQEYVDAPVADKVIAEAEQTLISFPALTLSDGLYKSKRLVISNCVSSLFQRPMSSIFPVQKPELS